MVMTKLEARVSKENWTVLEQVYQLATQHQDAGIVQTFLVHDAKDMNLWRIMTVWQSWKALDAMRSSGETPRGLLLFREAKAEPALTIFDVAQHAVW
jgi:hypothetical protein